MLKPPMDNFEALSGFVWAWVKPCQAMDRTFCGLLQCSSLWLSSSAFRDLLHVCTRLNESQWPCRDPTADLTFVLQLMVPGPPYLALTIAWSGSLQAGHPQAAAAAAADGQAATSSASPFQQLLSRLNLFHWGFNVHREGRARPGGGGGGGLC